MRVDILSRLTTGMPEPTIEEGRFMWDAACRCADPHEACRQTYCMYLVSLRWKVRRQQRLMRDQWRCQDCGARATEVHHLTYDRLFEELLNDLLSLCRRCHRLRHEETEIMAPVGPTFGAPSWQRDFWELDEAA
mgnify:CR=1 FL=1